MTSFPNQQIMKICNVIIQKLFRTKKCTNSNSASFTAYSKYIAKTKIGTENKTATRNISWNVSLTAFPNLNVHW